MIFVRPYVFVIDRLKPYGAERVCVTLLEEFAATGRRVVLVTYAADHHDAPTLANSIERIQLKRSKAKLLAIGNVTIGLRKTLTGLEPRAVLSFMPLANVLTLMATRGSGIRVIVTEHSIPSKSLKRSCLRGYVLRMLMWFWYPRAACVIAVSQDVKISLQAFLRRSQMNVRVIYNPINYSRLSIDSAAYRDASANLAEWHRSVGSPDCLVIVGSLNEAKGHSIAIDSLKLLPAQFELVFVGDGPLRTKLMTKANAAGLGRRVHFVGEYQDVTAWITLAHTVLVPSRWEGFGLIIAEAAYLGARVITSDALGVREIAHKVGAIICSLDSECFAQAILRPNIRAAQDRSWVKDFDPAGVATQYLTLLESS
jgi:glycosyltransferase involved in cell wall biosynthesis